jgi:hypothetical protein
MIARRADVLPKPPAAVAEPAVIAPHGAPPVPPPGLPALPFTPPSPSLQPPALPLETPASVARPPKPPRVEKPLCGILAWLLLLSGILVGFVMMKLFNQKDGVGIAFMLPPAWALIPLLFALCTSSRVRRSPSRILGLLLPPVASFGFMWLIESQPANGYEGWGYLFWSALPVALGLCAAPLLALQSLRRRERYPALAVTLLALYVLPCVAVFVALCRGAILGAWHDHGEAIREWMGVIVLIGVHLSAGGLYWRHTKKRVASQILRPAATVVH